MKTLLERFEHWTKMIGMNPAGFMQACTSRKRKLARGQPSATPYENMAAAVYREPTKPEVSLRAPARAQAVAMLRVGMAHNQAGRTADGKHDLAQRYGHASRSNRRQEAPLAIAA